MSDAFTSWTLEEAKAWLRARFEEGAACPCCHQFVKLYKRKLNSSMAFVVWLLAKEHAKTGTRNEIHVPSFLAKCCAKRPQLAAAVRGDWAKLQHWGLIDPVDGARPDGSKRSGYWRITEKGIRFARNQVSVASHLFFYNGGPLPWPSENIVMVTLNDALGERFDYRELMDATPEGANT